MQEQLNEESGKECPQRDAIKVHDSRFVRSIYLATGFVALILAAAGILLPILPTTPFVLLAAACFARSSKHFHEKLLAHRIAGPIIRDWFQYRSIRRQVKRWVYFLLAVSFSSSILMMPDLWQKATLALLGIILTAFIWRIPVRDQETDA
jgi:uncharacterized membrane protein YbaN (DUF454 family)